MIPNPIRKVLSSMRAQRVRALLMGGQACVFYGAAEFSRDTDFAILADAANLARLRKARAELRAGPIAVPPFALKYLRRGHAIHFRCRHPDALCMRVDVMSQMRGVPPAPAAGARLCPTDQSQQCASLIVHQIFRSVLLCVAAATGFQHSRAPELPAPRPCL